MQMKWHPQESTSSSQERHRTDRESRRRSVLVVASHFPEPSQTFVVDHLRGLVKNGWSVHFAARSLDSEGIRKLGLSELAEVSFHVLQAPGREEPFRRIAEMLSVGGLTKLSLMRFVNFRSAVYFASSLRRLLADIDPAIVHAHFAHNGLLASLAMTRARPLLVTFHGYDVLELPRQGAWKPYKIFLDRCDGVVHSEFLQSHVGNHLNTRLHRVTLGVDQELFKRGERPAEWPVPLRLLTVGRLVGPKGHAFAIRALSQLASTHEHLDPRLRVVGKGPQQAELETLVEELNLSEHVNFVGALGHREVAEEMAKADVLLVPSIRLGGSEETFSRVAIEGLASGLPVVGTRIGGLPATIGDAGYVVGPNDPGALASAVAYIVEFESPCTISCRAYARAAEFSIQRMWVDYEDVMNLVGST